MPSRHVVATASDGPWTIAITADTASTGLVGAVVEATAEDRTVRIGLGDIPVWRVARHVSGLYVHEASDRLLVVTDQDQDASGLIVVDLRAGAVVTSVKARHLTISPDRRYAAFEEYYSRLETDWPWNETVYAVLDVTSSGEASARTCPFRDDRCRGRLIHLPSRQDVCAAYRERTGNATCLVAGREPQHARRSPFIWLDAQRLAFISVDRVREHAVVVEAHLDPAFPIGADPASPGLTATAHACPSEIDERGAARGGCPSVRVPWTVDGIRRDDADGRLWIHFRNRIPWVPGGWLEVP